MEKDAVFWDFDAMNTDNRPKPPYSELSFQFLLRKIILWAVHETASQMSTTVDISWLSVALKLLPLRKNQQNPPIAYQTAIAIKLSHQWNKPIDQVVRYMERYLQCLLNGELNEGNGGAANVSLSPDIKKICRTLTLFLSPKGYMQFHGSTTTLTVWLQAMQKAIAHPTQGWKDDFGRCDGMENTPQSRVHSTSRQMTDAPITCVDIPFSVFYAHARACAILRMGHKMGHLRLRTLQTSENSIDIKSEALRPPWGIDQPKMLPWQVLFSDTQNDKKYIGAIAFSLLLQIITSLDQYADSTLGSDPLQKMRHQKRLETLLALGHAFCRFDANFALCDSDAIIAPCPSVPLRLSSLHASSIDPWPKQVSSLGLILISQRLLHDLLNDSLQQDHACIHIPDQL